MDFQAVIWDFGGVITGSPFEAFNHYEVANGLPRDFIRSVNARDPQTNAWAQFERSEIDAATFDTMFADESERLGHRLPGRVILPLLAGEIRPRMVAALDRCRAEGLKLGCITNNARIGHGPGMTTDPTHASAIEAVMARFDHVIQSAEAGVRKPDPRIYAMMVAALGVEPHACIYLDDLGINCKPAAAMGMVAIKVAGEEQALAELGAALGLKF